MCRDDDLELFAVFEMQTHCYETEMLSYLFEKRNEDIKRKYQKRNMPNNRERNAETGSRIERRRQRS